MIVDIIMLVILLAAVITLQLFAWKKNTPLLWVFTYVTEVFGNLFFLIEAARYHSKQSAQLAAETVSVNAPHYGTFTLICLYLALLFLTGIIVSIVLKVGKKKILLEEGHLFYFINISPRSGFHQGRGPVR